MIINLVTIVSNIHNPGPLINIPVDGPEVLKIVLLGQDEDDRVVSVSTAWVNLQQNRYGLTLIVLG